MPDSLSACCGEPVQSPHFPFHREGNRPKEVNRLARDDRAGLELGVLAVCKSRTEGRGSWKGRLYLLPRAVLDCAGPVCSLLSLASPCVRLICLIECLQHALFRGFTEVSPTHSIPGTV